MRKVIRQLHIKLKIVEKKTIITFPQNGTDFEVFTEASLFLFNDLYVAKWEGYRERVHATISKPVVIKSAPVSLHK